jgi:hypothetical protein
LDHQTLDHQTLDHQTVILFPKKKQTQIPILVSLKKKNKTRG